MPEFAPGEAKIARAPITVQPSGLSCQAEVFLGPDEVTKVATSGLVPFTSTGASQNVRLPVIMPSTEGSYHVYIDVYAEGILIAAYRALEGVVIVSVPVAVYRCVYCPATFSTEAALDGHMSSSHPGKPYLVYAYPEVSQVASGGTLYINYKVYTPTIPSGDRGYFWEVYIPDYALWTPYNSACHKLYGGTPEGFYIDTRPMYIKYKSGTKFYNIPPGTYPLYSRCRHLADVGEYAWGVIKTFWEDVDTGQTITVV